MDQLTISIGEVFLLGGLTLIGILMILAPKQGEKTFFGIVVLSAIMSIVYTHHSSHLEEVFLLKRFGEGKTIQCALLSGENVLVDPNNGWRYTQKIGFIKDDKILNNPGMCHVIGEKAPEPFVLTYLAILLIELALCFTLRAIIKERDKTTAKEGGRDGE